MVHLIKARQYQTACYDSEDIRNEILTLWNIGADEGHSFWDCFVIWLSSSLERHFGLLI